MEMGNTTAAVAGSLGDGLMRRPTSYSLVWLCSAALCAGGLSAVAEQPVSVDQLAANAIRAGEQRDVAAVNFLVEQLGHVSPTVRQPSAWALSQLGESASAAVPALVRALRDPDVRVRWGAATALGRMGRQADTAESALWQTTLDRDTDVRCAALMALRQVLSSRHSQARSALGECLQSPVPDVRAEGIATLSVLHSKWDDAERRAIVAPLAGIFATSDDDLRLAAAVLLGDLGLSAAEALAELAGATDDIDEHVQAAALRAVGRIFDEIDRHWSQLDAAQHGELRQFCEAAARVLESRGRETHEAARLAKQLQKLLAGIQLSSGDDAVALERPARQSPNAAVAAAQESPSKVSKPATGSWHWALAVVFMGAGIWGLRHGLPVRPVTSGMSAGSNGVEATTIAGGSGTRASSSRFATLIDSARGHGDNSFDVVASVISSLHNDAERVPHTTAGRFDQINLGARDSIPQLIDALLGDFDPRVRATAALAISSFGAQAVSAVPALRAALIDEVASVRARAVFALGQIGPAAHRAAEELARLVSDPDVSVRRNVASALGGIGADATLIVPALQRAAGDDDAGVRRCAMTTLTLIDADSAAAALQTVADEIAEGDETSEMMSESQTLHVQLSSPDLELSSNAIDAQPLAQGDQAAPDLKLFCPEQVEASLAADACQQPTEAADFIFHLEDNDADVRWQATHGLAQLGAAAVPEMIGALNHRNPAVRRLLIVALGHTGVEARAAMPALLVALHDVNSDVRCAAADCLGQVGVVSRAVVQALMQSLSDPNCEVRRYSATTLGRFGQQGREATTALQIASISDNAVKVRTAAQTAFQRISESLVGAA